MNNTRYTNVMVMLTMMRDRGEMIALNELVTCMMNTDDDLTLFVTMWLTLSNGLVPLVVSVGRDRSAQNSEYRTGVRTSEVGTN